MRVVTGLERWLSGEDTAGLAAGARLGLVAHPASVDAQARHAVELVRAASRFRMLRLFAPEHGLWGREQDMERVAAARERASELPVVSLYGADAASLRPTRAALADLDAVVVDLQDVGARYYTFVYTLSYVMEAAAEAAIPVIVLDRPNPLGGELLEGPLLDPRWASFVGRYPLPVRHGMTIGELARYFHRELGVGAAPRVVALGGWRRWMRFADTGLPWVPPSPNMPALTTATVYPGGCLIEGTNLSEGRGTTLPFELVGAPWLDGRALAERLRAEPHPGAAFRAAGFRPMFQKHGGEPCEGVQVIVREPARFRPFRCYLALIREARAQAPQEFDWRREVYEFERERLAIDLLLGRTELRGMLEAQATTDEMEALWEAELRAFADRRRSSLLYGP
ncbi:MAG TPA: DUF1343 domain-containing protein [Candidatus Polarisedimenticolaceae bacterium]|nr:DUF1343 domain-containing protein [Candidatus Polarisedimenticolaceae bacterium]